ncbi:glycine cleavage system aminomethyltransferase GcvT [Thermoflavifilum thermophilum]|uniref:Aminomethyltransferase n=1 Tax=Thermoflavifilum thermophilum TaxID=1393122 RepID=A0A1I7NA44_9BACT|nr:glycine cleavage system aminomethyltransferase GcvT [Thermoflavifilum thermophilum]SFV31426.1 aminomethyltransferase [Thermoflavifilum thermophilum]
MIKVTPFHAFHRAAGAHMAAFAGYEMPIYYTSIQEEHLAVRQRAGLFDVSHMGEFIIRGPQALDLVQLVTTNDAAKLSDGQAQYSCMTHERGGVLDDLIVYCIEKQKVYMLVVNAANIAADREWIIQHNAFDAEVVDISEKTCLLALQGPAALNILQPFTDVDLIKLPYYRFVKTSLLGFKPVLISATGYTGAGGVELYFENKDQAAETIWQALTEAGKPYDMKLAGLGARDTLRLEMGYCLYGHELNPDITPLEAGLGWIVKWNKDFIGKPALLQQKEQGIARKLVGFRLIEKGIPRQDYSILDMEGRPIGHVTSGSFSPSLNQPIGLGYVETAYAQPDTPIQIRIRNQNVKAVVTSLPFLKKS